MWNRATPLPNGPSTCGTVFRVQGKGSNELAHIEMHLEMFCTKSVDLCCTCKGAGPCPSAGFGLAVGPDLLLSSEQLLTFWVCSYSVHCVVEIPGFAIRSEGFSVQEIEDRDLKKVSSVRPCPEV